VLQRLEDGAQRPAGERPAGDDVVVGAEDDAAVNRRGRQAREEAPDIGAAIGADVRR
jgi:hypothetical protein